MKKGMVTAVSVVAVVIMAGSVYASCGSCPGDKPKSASASTSSSSDVYTSAELADLGLSSTQTKRIEAAKSACKKKIETILTNEQKGKLTAASAPAACAAPAKKKGGCR